LRTVWGRKEILLSELAKKYGKSIYKIIYDMEGKGVVKVESNGKRKTVMVTELGEDVLDQNRPRRIYRLGGY
ncbi:MAG: hypothetical protein C0172_01785, partial [Caldisphaera sp.]